MTADLQLTCTKCSVVFSVDGFASEGELRILAFIHFLSCTGLLIYVCCSEVSVCLSLPFPLSLFSCLRVFLPFISTEAYSSLFSVYLRAVVTWQTHESYTSLWPLCFLCVAFFLPCFHIFLHFFISFCFMLCFAQCDISLCAAAFFIAGLHLYPSVCASIYFCGMPVGCLPVNFPAFSSQSSLCYL